MAKIDLTPFCEDYENKGRYAIGKPWRFGEFVQATDGRVAIQIACALAPEVGEPEGRVPRFDDILSPVDSIAKWEPCPAVGYCAECLDTGKVLVTCEYCKGSGQCVCSCGDEHSCGNCDDGECWDGAWCEACAFHFGNRQLQHKYMRVIAKLPNCELATVDDDPSKAVFFRFTGGVGAIMPATRPECAKSK